MASPPRLPTPAEDASLQTDHSPSDSPGTAGMSALENYGHPENYFQPINDHETLHSEFTAETTGSSYQDVGTTEQFVSSQQISSPDVTPQSLPLQTCSPVSSYLTPRHDALLPETQTSSNIISTCTFNSENSLSESSHAYSSPSSSYSSLLHNKSSSPLLLSYPSPHSAEIIDQLDQDTVHVSHGPCSDQPEDSEVTSLISNPQRTNSELVGGSFDALKGENTQDSIQKDAKKLGKDPQQNKMTCIIDDSMIPGDDILESSNISDPITSLCGTTNPTSPVEENVVSVNTQESVKTIITLPDLLSTEASVEMTSTPGTLSLVPDVSINQNQFDCKQTNQSDVKHHIPTTMLEAKSGGSADCMPVLYLQVTKMGKEEPQRNTDKKFEEPIVSSNESDITTNVSKNVKNDDLQNLHGEQGHQVLDKKQKTLHVMFSSTKPEQRVSRKAPTSSPTNIHPYVTSGPVAPVPATQYTDWTPQSMSGSNYNSYYGPFYPDYRYTDPLFSDKYSLHNSRAQHAWRDLKGYWPQKGPDVQSYDQQNNQKEDCRQKRLEQCNSEHVHYSDHSGQKRSKTKSLKPDQDKCSPYWSENYTKYYNSGGWNPQEYYSNAYYRDYYYPYNYGYQAEVSKGQTQQYNTKPDSYDDWWRYDPRYDSTFDHENVNQYQQSYWDQCDRQSSHSGYSTQSMPSTRSSHSRFSWHSEKSWGPSLECTDRPTDDVTIQSPASSKGPEQIENITSTQDFNVAHSSKSPPIQEQLLFPHCCARFGSGGQLIQVLPNLPSEGKPALVQMHNIEMMLQGCEGQLELQNFPGPLIKDRTHKSEVLDLIKKKHQECLQNNALADKEAACLIWELMELVCRQNGKLVGTDISHLLLRNPRSPSSSKRVTSDLIDFTHEALNNTLETQAHNAESTTEEHFWMAPQDTERDLQSFREFLIFGRKKDALETAVSKGLWGHAFMLASKMDSRAYSQVMSSFIDHLSENDALRTFYQLMSGRIPSVAHHNNKKWDDWCIHLAMVLSNHTRFKHLHKKTIIRMAESLASSKRFDAATFCYMVGQLSVDTQSDKSDIFLFGTSPNFPPLKYATNEAIQRTELFEYALSLGSDSVYLPNFQILKFMYACRLAEAGLCTQAFQYCEVISNALLASGSGQSLTLIDQLIELSAKIRQVDQQLKDFPELELETDWMVNLRKLRYQIIEELNSSSSKQQHSSLLPTLGASNKVCILTTDMPKEESGLPEVHLVPPAPQGILENRSETALSKSSQIVDPGPCCLQTIPISVSPKSSQQINPNVSTAEEPVQVVNPQDVYKSERLDDAELLSESQYCEGKEPTATMALSLPALPTRQPICPTMPNTSSLKSPVEDFQSQSLNVIPQSIQFTAEPHALSSTSPSDSLATESNPSTAQQTVTAILPSSMSEAKELLSVPHLIAPYESHLLPSTKSSSSMVPSSVLLATKPDSVPHLTALEKEPHRMFSTLLPSSMSMATESELVPQLSEPYIETIPTAMCPLSMSLSLATESGSVHQLTAPHIESHTLPSTMLNSSASLAKESEALPQLPALQTESQTLPAKSLTSTMSLAQELEFVPQLTAPLPFLPSGQHCQKHSFTQSNVDVAPSPVTSTSNHWVTEQNLQSHEVQPAISSSATIQAPQLLHPVSDGTPQSSFTMESPTVPLLTVPLPDSQVLPQSKSDCSTTHSKHTAEFRPPNSSCLPDQVLDQKPPPLSSVNPYAMGQKIVHSKQIHMQSKPLIPKLFVPQNPPPDPQPKKESEGGWLSWLFGKKKEVQLPADTSKSLVWDENLQRWVDPNEMNEKSKSTFEYSKGVLRTTPATSGECDEPSKKGLFSAMSVLRSGPKKGYMAPLNPVLMSNNPGTQLYASPGITSTETQMIKTDNINVTGPPFSGQLMEKGKGLLSWTQSQKSPTAGSVDLYNPSQFSQDIL